MERLGVVVVTKPHEQFVPGDTIYTLTYTGEGYNDIWYRGQTLNIEIFWPTYDEVDSANIRLDDPRWEQFSSVMVARPLMVWWVNILFHGATQGWIRLENTTIAGFHIDEKIDGIDMLGGAQ